MTKKEPKTNISVILPIEMADYIDGESRNRSKFIRKAIAFYREQHAKTPAELEAEEAKERADRAKIDKTAREILYEPGYSATYTEFFKRCMERHTKIDFTLMWEITLELWKEHQDRKLRLIAPLLESSQEDG